MKRLALALFALLVAAPAGAATVVTATVEELARSADLVVRGTVEARQARFHGARIYTTLRIRASAAWKGSAAEVVEVEIPGGVVGDVGQKVSGVAAFAEGEEVVLFLRRGGGAAYGVMGLSQGKFRVEGDTAKNEVGGLYRLEKPIPPGERVAEEMPLAELERRVRSAR
ncbi:MAG: hypothetical protein HZB56_15465 [Deltaproteobacteria bacterium]|nr:hypothetical protein [Deltaproteobacteria bacterium]